MQLDPEWELNEWKINLMLEIFIEPDAVKISQNKEHNVDLSIDLCSMDGHSYEWAESLAQDRFEAIKIFLHRRLIW